MISYATAVRVGAPPPPLSTTLPARPPTRWTLKYDNIAKPFAFLCVAHFFRAFPTPEKIMLQVSHGFATLARTLVACSNHVAPSWQVYVALCRLSQSSDAAARDAVRQGIDLMISNLARALAHDASTAISASAAVGALSLEAAADSLLSKDSTPSGAVAGTTGNASLTSSPSYARYLKRVLSEDGHISLTLVHVLQVIVRNRDMFYPNR